MALLSIVPFITYLGSYNYQFIGSADYISPINITNIIYQRLFVYSPLIDHGQPIAFLIANLFSNNILFFMLEKIGISSLLVTLFYLSLLIFLTQISFYIFIKYILENKLDIKLNNCWVALPGAIIFGFSPYMVTLIPPGHFIQMTSYALIPYLLKTYDEDIHKKNVSLLSLLKYFIIFLFSSSAFGNVGIIYVVLLTLFLYSIISIIITRTSIFKTGFFFGLTTFIIIVSNSFWLLPYANILSPMAKLDTSSYSLSSENFLNIAVRSASIPNLFLGRIELSLLKNQAYVNIIPAIIYLYFFCFFIYGLIKSRKNRFVILLFILTIISLFITKGPHPPFPEPFLWFYRNVIGFQIFRRPVSKYYFMFLFFYLSLTFIGITLADKKLKFEKHLILIKLPLILASVYFILAFTSTKEMIPFNIPKGYQNALNDLKKSKVNKILMLPGLSTIQPIYNHTLNNLYATDFLQFYWPYPLVHSDIQNVVISTKPQQLNVQLINQIRKNQSVCNITKKLGISHFMLRQNMADYSWFEDKPQDMFNLLIKNPDIASYKTYSEKNQILFTLFQLKNNCTEQLILISKNTDNLSYRQINPVTYSIKFTNLKNPVVLEHLLIYDPFWQILSTTNGQPIAAINSTHRDNGDGFNAWKINPHTIINQLPNFTYSVNPDKSINIDLLLYYSNQKKFYQGLSIFIISLLLIILFIVYQSRKKSIKLEFENKKIK